MAVDYATIVENIVTDTTVGAGSLPDNDVGTSTYYHLILAGETMPDVGDYFDHECQTFSPTLPDIDPGEVAPSNPTGPNDPILNPGDVGHPGPPLFPGLSVPAVLAEQLVSFIANGNDPFVIANCPAALTELSPLLRQLVRLGNVCEVAVETHVVDALPGAEIVMCWQLTNTGPTDNADYAPLSRAGTGPIVDLGESGRGDALNVAEDAQRLVWVSPHVRNGDDDTNVSIGNLLLVLGQKVDPLAVCAEIEEEAPVAGCDIEPGIEATDFSEFADYDDLWTQVDDGTTGLFGLLSDLGQTGLGGDDPELPYGGIPQVMLDSTHTFNSKNGVTGRYTNDVGDDGHIVYGVPIYQWYPDGPIASNDIPDITVKRVMELEDGIDFLDGEDPTVDSGKTGLNLIEAGVYGTGGHNFLNIALRNGKFFFDYYPSGSSRAGVELADIADWTGRPIQWLYRVERLTSTSYRFSIYLNDACASPSLLYTEDFTVAFTNPSLREIQHDQYYIFQVGDGSAGLFFDVTTYQLSYDTDASTYGL